MAGRLPGDQTHPCLALTPAGGYLVWEDNVTDGDGLGISALKLNNTFSGELGAFRVNGQSAGDQENPQVAMLKGGQVVFVWQGGTPGFQRVYVRFLDANGTFMTGDIPVGTPGNNAQVNPVVTGLVDGSALVVWADVDQASGMQDVFAQRFSAAGQPINSQQINQYNLYNQRTPAVAALPGGGFVAVWVSEQQRYDNSVDIYARLYDAAFEPLGSEFCINSSSNVCANPTVAAGNDGGFIVAWSQRFSQVPNLSSSSIVAGVPGGYTGRVMLDGSDAENGWEIYARAFDSQSTAIGQNIHVNSFTYGDQFAPRISARGTDYLVVWTSLGQDGSWEGVYGRFFNGAGVPEGDESRVNTTIQNRQLHPALASDGDTRFLVAWSSFVDLTSSFDLFGQRFVSGPLAQSLPKPAAPFVSGLSSSRLSVSWPPMDGYAVDHYELFINGPASPVQVTNNYYVAMQLVPGSTNSVQLRFQSVDGRVSPLSDPALGVTWGEDENMDGLPDDWQA
ncbi:MAG: hypothetical protein M1608_09650, partial [Candidatus Omnitrophica bacterium]|nr:hypothetical protein [Candidatus Omnitrophota bacterium]